MCEAESAILFHIPYSAPNNGECRKPREGMSESLHGKSAEENPKCGIFEKTLCQWGQPKKSKNC